MAVHAREGYVIEAQIDAELGPVVDQMIDETADDFGTDLRHGKLVAETEGPVLLHVFIGSGGDRGSSFFNGFVEHFEEFGGGAGNFELRAGLELEQFAVESHF